MRTLADWVAACQQFYRRAHRYIAWLFIMLGLAVLWGWRAADNIASGLLGASCLCWGIASFNPDLMGSLKGNALLPDTDRRTQVAFALAMALMVMSAVMMLWGGRD